MLGHFILAVCYLVVAFIMIGALIVIFFAIREGALMFLEWMVKTTNRRRQHKNDIRQSRQHERLRNGDRSS